MCIRDRYVSGSSIPARMQRAAELAAQPGPPGLIYVYVPELDMAAHAHGWESREWTAALEATDSAVRDLVAALGPRAGLLVTADRGIIDVPTRSHVLIDSAPALLDGIRFVAGEPRCLPVSYTHLDVYKRQPHRVHPRSPAPAPPCGPPRWWRRMRAPR